jgi:hypothetical protein
MKLSTRHTVLPDASDFADVVGSSPRAMFEVGALALVTVRLDDLRVRSGGIIASDGYVLDRDAEPFARPIPSGDYPLTLLIADIDGDERIAFAQVKLSPQPVVRWEMAAPRDAEPLQPGQMYGYGVDSGTGCFADAAAYKLVAAQNETFSDRLMAEAEKVYRDTRDWVGIDTPRGSMAVFSSGVGDGFYGCYFGLAADGSVVSLVTDFGVLRWAMSEAEA